MARVRVQDLVKLYGPLRAVDGVSLAVEEGEFFALLGPSGCGKTTTLRCIAGLERPSQGEIIIGEQPVTSLPAYERPCGMVFQSYALFPHLSVFDNVAYGLRARLYRQGGPLTKAAILGSFLSRRAFPLDAALRERVREALHLVGLDGQEGKAPGQLSGGMQQRVALARALVTEPAVLLLDEPLSNLDRKLRVSMRGTIRKIQQALRITAIYVTHDQEEALSLADRLAIMDRGRIVQLGTPAEIYDRPATPFVADFIGAENLFPARAIRSGPDLTLVEAGDLTFRAAGQPKAERVRAVVRPQAIRLARPEEPLAADNLFRGEVRFGAYLGATARYEVAVKNLVFVVDVPDPRPGALYTPGDQVQLGFAAESVLLVEEA
ncbi:MAG: ABC transporter ATP-binding protein [candidate division NC10 bacterium]|nr:ABC transporter ATP-binding protein [candidate division NC10 bacterium]MBI2116565.1 ABC transporter ATP-binding protein [candidate division NC10 bacterium]